jgi:hypothetical protein
MKTSKNDRKILESRHTSLCKTIVPLKSTLVTPVAKFDVMVTVKLFEYLSSPPAQVETLKTKPADLD